MQTIAHLYDSYDTAQRVVNELEAAGFSHDHVSIVANQSSSQTMTAGTGTSMDMVTPGLAAPTSTMTGSTLTDATMPGTMTGTTTTGTTMGDTTTGAPVHTGAGTGAGAGASIGTIIGGGAGLLAGIGALAIPGVGPVIAAGWLIATLTGAGAGAAAGGLLGSLTGAGVPEDNAHVYAEGVRRGSTLVTVRADDNKVSEAESIMARYMPVDIAQRGAGYRADGGWDRFDETRGTMTPEELAAERARVTTTTGTGI